MGLKNAPRAPPQPNPADLVKAQAEENRISQFTPQGNLLFGRVSPEGEFILDPAKSQAAAQVEETPFQEEARGIGEDISLDLARILGGNIDTLNPIDVSGLPGLVTGLETSGLPTLGSASGTRGRLEGATFKRLTNLLRPELDREERILRQRLANQGLPTSSEAASGEFGELTRFGRRENEALLNAAISALQIGGTEASRDIASDLAIRGAGVGEQLSEAQLVSLARSQGLGEQQAIRGGSIQELASLLGGQAFNPVGTGSFFAPGQIDVLGPQQLSQNAALAAFNAANQANATTTAGLFGLGNTAITGGALAIF